MPLLPTPFISDVCGKLTAWLERREYGASDALIDQTISTTCRRHGLDPDTVVTKVKRDGKYVFFSLQPTGASEAINVGAID